MRKKMIPVKRVKRISPRLLLSKKIERIKNRTPNIDPTGECKDEETGEVLFRFTEAQHVFDVYRTECDIEGLRYRPYIDEHIQPKVISIGNMPMLIGTFCIEDIKTGAKVIGWGAGMGRNFDWSGNTANTRALKQFLLTVFEANWQDPQDPIQTRQQLRDEVLRELEADGTLSKIEQIKFWSQNLRKEKSDADTEGKNTEARARRGDKKNRERA